MRILKRFMKNDRANVAVMFGLSSVVLIAVGGGAVDYMAQSSAYSHLQSVADSAVIVSAKELQLSGINSFQAAQISAVADSYIQHNIDANLVAPQVNVKVFSKKGIVDLDVSAIVKTPFMSVLGLGSNKRVKASASARILGGLPLCILALEETDAQAIWATNKAKVTATGCTVHANSTHTETISATGNTLLHTGLTCSSGGTVGSGLNYNPSPVTDCPPIEDPLADRLPPTTGSVVNCDFNMMTVNSGFATLDPGVYCGGITIKGNANVELNPGIYTMRDGKLDVNGTASLSGEHVGFYLTGTGATVRIRGTSNIELHAPKDGPMAGLLFFEDRNQSTAANHEITSRNAKILVGTIYLSRGTFIVAATGGNGANIANESAFTVIVARKLRLRGTPNLVLNTDFAATDVPLPNGIANLSGEVVLSR